MNGKEEGKRNKKGSQMKKRGKYEQGRKRRIKKEGNGEVYG